MSETAVPGEEKVTDGVQTPPADPGQQPAAAAPPEPEPPAKEAKPAKPDPELAAKLKRLEALEKAEAEREKAKLTESERVARERQELALDRYRLDLEKAGLPTEVAQQFRAAPEKNAQAAVESVASAWKAALAKAVKAAQTNGSENTGRGGGTPPIDPARRPAAGQQTQDINAPYRDMVKLMRQKARGA